MKNETQNSIRPTKIPAKPIDPLGSILNHLPMVMLLSLGIFCAGFVGVLLKVKPTTLHEMMKRLEISVDRVPN